MTEPLRGSKNQGWMLPKIGALQLQTPFGLAPFNSGLFSQSGSAQGGCLDFYRSFCNPSLGLLVIGGIAVSPEGKANRGALCLNRPHRLTGIQEVAAIAKDNGVALAVQLEHAGRQACSVEIGYPIVGPSSIPCPVFGEAPRALTVDEIAKLVRGFAQSAEIAINAGAELVEIHAAHGYLVSGFLSGASNKRCDRYGGDIRRRFTFLEEIVSLVYDRVGPRVGLRINVYERSQEGITPSQVVNGLRPFSHKLAYISVSGGSYEAERDVVIPRRSLGRALWRSQARLLRKELEVPIMIAGNIDSVRLALDILRSQDADVVLLGRSLLADPNLILKYHGGVDSQPCIDCGLCKYHSKGFPTIYCPFHPVLQKLSYPKVYRRSSRRDP